MKESGLIDNMIISFYLSHGDQSNFTFGFYNEDLIKDGSADQGYGIHWYELTGKNWW